MARQNVTTHVQCGSFGGWGMYVRDGKPGYTYNFLGLHRDVIESPDALPAGKVKIEFVFDYAGGGFGKGGKGTLRVNGKQVATGPIKQTQGFIFSADETADVGLDNQTPAYDAVGYGPDETKFTGKIDKAVVEVI